MSDNEKKIEIQEKLWEIQEDDKQVEERMVLCQDLVQNKMRGSAS